MGGIANEYFAVIGYKAWRFANSSSPITVSISSATSKTKVWFNLSFAFMRPALDSFTKNAKSSINLFLLSRFSFG
jgi:hypothetical protein